MPRSPSRPPDPAAAPLTARDLAVLELAAQQRLLRAAHAARLLSVSERTAERRLGRLRSAGWLTSTQPFDHLPRIYQITTRGLRAIGSNLPRPRLAVDELRHDLGVCSLWLAARQGAFGPLREIHSERELRSRQRRRLDGLDAPLERLAVRSGARGPAGGERLHFPDLVLLTAEGRRVAVELELSGKGRRRLEGILAGYGADRRFDAVLYLTDDRALAERLRRAARRLGCESLVLVAEVRLAEPARAEMASAAHRVPGRLAARRRAAEGLER